MFRYLQKYRASHGIEKTSRSMKHNRHCPNQECRAKLESWFGYPLDFLNWLGEEWNTSITKSLRSRAGIHPCVNLDQEKKISASVELCETDVCFLTSKYAQKSS